jgi:hypothetical protein
LTYGIRFFITRARSISHIPGMIGEREREREREMERERREKEER